MEEDGNSEEEIDFCSQPKMQNEGLMVQIDVCYGVANNLPDMYLNIVDLKDNKRVEETDERVFKIPKLLNHSKESTPQAQQLEAQNMFLTLKPHPVKGTMSLYVHQCQLCHLLTSHLDCSSLLVQWLPLLCSLVFKND